MFMATMNLGLGEFKALNANPEGTLERFTKYVERINLIFDLPFKKSEKLRTREQRRRRRQCSCSEAEIIWKTFFKYVRKVTEAESFEGEVENIMDGLKACTNSIAIVMHFVEMASSTVRRIWKTKH